MKVTQAMTKTPADASPDYDWRKEPWVDDAKVRALSLYIAHHVMTALAAGGVDAQDEEDASVFLSLNPQITEQVWKGPEADNVIRYRVACAVAQGIDLMISAWLKQFGSIDHKGPAQRPETIARSH